MHQLATTFAVAILAYNFGYHIDDIYILSLPSSSPSSGKFEAAITI